MSSGSNGNGWRQGQGYRLRTDGGWLAKAGYPHTALAEFLGDLAALAARLGITVVGFEPREYRFLSLEAMQGLAGVPAGRHVLDASMVRIYTSADYVDRWNQFFGWKLPAPGPNKTDRVANLHVAIKKAGVSQRDLATRMKMDPSSFSKMLRGKKPWPVARLDKAFAAAAEASAPTGEPAVKA